MTLDQIAVFTVACLVFMASPGPGVFAVISRSLAMGYRHNIGLILGMMLGDLTFLSLAILGLAALGHSVQAVFPVLRYLAGAYLIWLGIKTWRAPVADGDLTAAVAESRARGFVSGLLLTLSNPKTITFYMAFLPAFIDLARLTLMDGLAVAGVVAVTLFAVMSAYSLASSQARQWFKGGRAIRNLNRGAAGLMVGSGLAIAAR